MSKVSNELAALKWPRAELAIEKISFVFGCHPEAILGKVRSATIGRARSACYLLLSDGLGMSQPEIAAALKRLDSSTVFSGLRSARALYRDDADFRARVLEVSAFLVEVAHGRPLAEPQSTRVDCSGAA